MILGYTLATFPKVMQYIYLCTTQEEIRTLAQFQEKGPCIIGGEYPDIRFSTQQKKNGTKIRKEEIRNLQNTRKRTTLSFV